MSADLTITRFANLRDLGRLPWFDVKDGRLVVDDVTVGPSIDMHTHLALSFVRRNQLDLLGRTERTEHYLDEERPFDLEVYINRNIPAADLKRMEKDLALGSFSACGMRATHTIGNLMREMAELGVKSSVLLPIDFPPPLSANASTWIRAAADQRAIVCFGSVHPYSFGVGKQLDRQKAMGARGIKLHPAVQMVPPDDKRMLKVVRACAVRDLPVFFHCGPVDIETALGRRFSQVRRYEQAIAENPEATIVLGHSGALQMDEAIAFAKRYRYVMMELASQSLTNVKRLLAELPVEQIVFGTDWPFYHQAIGLAKVLIATEGRPADRRAILYDNAARILRL